MIMNPSLHKNLSPRPAIEASEQAGGRAPQHLCEAFKRLHEERQQRRLDAFANALRTRANMIGRI